VPGTLLARQVADISSAKNGLPSAGSAMIRSPCTEASVPSSSSINARSACASAAKRSSARRGS